MKTGKISLANVQGKLSRNEMKEINGGTYRMACASCSPTETVCVWYNDATTHCTDSGYGQVFCVGKNLGEQNTHSCME
jgi:hypothetical protein